MFGVVCRNCTEFCMLTFCPLNLLNLTTSFVRFFWIFYIENHIVCGKDCFYFLMFILYNFISFTWFTLLPKDFCVKQIIRVNDLTTFLISQRMQYSTTNLYISYLLIVLIFKEKVFVFFVFHCFTIFNIMYLCSCSYFFPSA
jgi:hypothetical protein